MMLCLNLIIHNFISLGSEQSGQALLRGKFHKVILNLFSVTSPPS